MKRRLFCTVLVAVVSTGTWLECAAAAPAGLDTARIERLTGLKGKLDDKEHVFTVSLPRDDLKVTVAGATVTPPMGLTAWTAFTRVGDRDEVMGDLVLVEDQVNPVMSAALDNGLEVTGLHNHFFWDTPKVWFMHIAARGDESKLASAVGKVFDKLKETRGHLPAPPRVAVDPVKSTLDTKAIDRVMRTSGELKDGVYKITVGRTTRMDGHPMGKAMGVNTWAAFAGSDQEAAVDGDFATLPGELQPVLKALRGAGINIVAIHNHMLGEQPPVIFLHYWGTGPTEALAKGVRAALDTQRR